MSGGFAFKQFTVHDDRCQMKVGTDGVLLGAWASVEGALSVLDVGTGSGLIALMIAQRQPAAIIDGVELLEADAKQATENVASSPWSDRITIHQCALQEFNSPHRYDLIISNPPFFNKSLLPPQQQRASVRHTTTLTHEDLLAAVSRLLKPGGTFAIILPSQGYDPFVALAEKAGLHVRRVLEFMTRPGRPVERRLLELSFQSGDIARAAITLYTGEFRGSGRDNWSSDYQKLVGDFYI